MAERVCPWWMGYFLANPFRRLWQNPDRILSPYMKPGMVALDVGPGMGFFTLPLARLVGEGGRVVAVDLQEKMLSSLKRRAARAGLAGRIEVRTCTASSLTIDDLADRIDFALAFAVLHEIPDMEGALTSMGRSLRRGGVLLIAEPRGHTSEGDLQRTLAIARDGGLELVSTPDIRWSRSLLLRKPDRP
jgi:ubiquinone/menaquinone biosynthesis C-methylase UbiE